MAGLGGFVPPVIIEIQASAAAAIAQFKEVNGQLTEMQVKAEATGTSMNNMGKASAFAGSAMMAIGVAAAAVGALSVKAALDSEGAFARMNTAIKNTGDTSAATQKQFKDLADNSTNLGFSVVSTATALGTLTTATHSTKEAQELLTATMDYARYKHLDLATAATTVARATQGSAKAFQALGITLDTHLPKQEAINKALDEFAKRVSGQNDAYLKTFAGRVSVLTENAGKLAEQIGSVLVPIISGVIGFVNNFKGEIEFLVAAVVGAVVAFKAYETVMNLYKAAQIIYIALTTGGAAAQTALTFATEGGAAATKSMTAAQWLLNAAMDANPIGLIIAGVTALIAVLYELWKHCDDVRNIMISVAEAGIKAFGWIIQIVGDLVKAIMELVTGPMHLMLEALAFVHAPGAKTALADLNGAIQAVGNTFDKAATSVYNYSNQLDKLRKSGTSASKATPSAGSTAPFDLHSYTGATTTPKNTAASKAAAALTKDQASVQTIYGQMLTDLKDYNTKYQAEVDAKNTRDSAAQDAYNQTAANAERTFNDDKFKTDRDYAQKVEDLTRTHNEALAKAQEAYDYTAQQEAQKNADAVAKIYDDYNTKIADLQQSAADKAVQLQTDAATKQADIIKQSAALLTDEFSRVTSVDVGKTFATFPSLSGLLGSLKDQLAGAKQLASDAAALAAQGYSQTFIQQVVAQGPQVGDQMAQAILNATPDTKNQLQSLYGQLQDTSQNGVTALANQMSTGTSLATKALTDQYAQVNVDLQQALADNQTALSTALTAEQKNLNDQLAAQQKSYTDTMASAQKTLNDAIESANQSFTDGLANAKQTQNNALQDMTTTLNNTLADANTTLQKALTDSATTFNGQVTALQTDTMNKLSALQTKLAAVAAAIAKISGASAGVGALASSPAAPFLAGTSTLPTTSTGTTNTDNSVNVTVNGTNLSDPNATASTVTNAIRLGVTNKLSGMAIM